MLARLSRDVRPLSRLLGSSKYGALAPVGGLEAAATLDCGKVVNTDAAAAVFVKKDLRFVVVVALPTDEDRGGDGGASECTETATSIGTSNRITLKVMIAFGILLNEE